MKNLVMALMMLLVLGTGFLLGSKYSLNDDQIDILELTNNTSNNMDNQNHLKGDLSKSKEGYGTTDNQKYDFEEIFNNKSNKENNEPVSNKSINEEQTNEENSNLTDENSDKKGNNQSVNNS